MGASLFSSSGLAGNPDRLGPRPAGLACPVPLATGSIPAVAPPSLKLLLSPLVAGRVLLLLSPTRSAVTVLQPRTTSVPGTFPDLGAGRGSKPRPRSPTPADISVLPGSQRSVVMRVSETHQWKDSSHKAASSPGFGKTIRDLPL